MSDQDKLTQNFAALFLGVFLVGGGLFIWWAGRKTTAGRWHHAQATVVWSLFAIGLVGIALGLNLASWVQADWGQTAGVISFQIGLFLIFISLCWYGFLDLRYPLDPANVLNDPRRGDVGRYVAFESFLIALIVGHATFSVLYWTSSAILALGVGFAAFAFVFCVAALVLTLMMRHSATGG